MCPESRWREAQLVGGAGSGKHSVKWCDYGQSGVFVSMAAVTHHPELGGLKQRKRILPQFRKPKSRISFTGLKSNCPGLHNLGGSEGESLP